MQNNDDVFDSNVVDGLLETFVAENYEPEIDPHLDIVNSVENPFGTIQTRFIRQPENFGFTFKSVLKKISKSSSKVKKKNNFPTVQIKVPAILKDMRMHVDLYEKEGKISHHLLFSQQNEPGDPIFIQPIEYIESQGSSTAIYEINAVYVCKIQQKDAQNSLTKKVQCFHKYCGNTPPESNVISDYIHCNDNVNKFKLGCRIFTKDENSNKLLPICDRFYSNELVLIEKSGQILACKN